MSSSGRNGPTALPTDILLILFTRLHTNPPCLDDLILSCKGVCRAWRNAVEWVLQKPEWGVQKGFSKGDGHGRVFDLGMEVGPNVGWVDFPLHYGRGSVPTEPESWTMRVMLHPTLHGGPLVTIHTRTSSHPTTHTLIVDGSSGLESLQQCLRRVGRTTWRDIQLRTSAGFDTTDPTLGNLEDIVRKNTISEEEEQRASVDDGFFFGGADTISQFHGIRHGEVAEVVPSFGSQVEGTWIHDGHCVRGLTNKDSDLREWWDCGHTTWKHSRRLWGRHGRMGGMGPDRAGDAGENDQSEQNEIADVRDWFAKFVSGNVEQIADRTEEDPYRYAGLMIGSRAGLDVLDKFLAKRALRGKQKNECKTVPTYLFAILPSINAHAPEDRPLPIPVTTVLSPEPEPSTHNEGTGKETQTDFCHQWQYHQHCQSAHARTGTSEETMLSKEEKENPYTKFKATIYFVWPDYTTCSHAATPDQPQGILDRRFSALSDIAQTITITPAPDETDPTSTSTTTTSTSTYDLCDSFMSSPDASSSRILQTIEDILDARRPLDQTGRLDMTKSDMDPFYIVLSQRNLKNFESILHGAGLRAGSSTRWLRLSPRWRRYGLLGMNEDETGSSAFAFDFGKRKDVRADGAVFFAEGAVGFDANFGKPSVALGVDEI
ncbi:uncharacterized protein SPPG_04433 [Spizellomyces punctatus DAOM BR117]|uniref:F-box domain-containing protein n=1 Tax=Spizellomyces punctatus (strain DAOM BR117) TaxID=645134 RepID=A0A0L0HGF7_SPIPD|nr:uncharacterized protein SPPG_04433 [Spizellomyces punctatus DAOM BR117]KND00092.1 hypothetical protein SPPG_04433 [Spizellomyces punctatus DAOM BR117]|eukprot:XP_016608131.1 hypothetical protein SPPG_04433 [Spizellomyces punctatus DAOM BR117]